MPGAYPLLKSPNISETIQIPHIYVSYENMHSILLVGCTPGPFMGVPYPFTS